METDRINLDAGTNTPPLINTPPLRRNEFPPINKPNVFSAGVNSHYQFGRENEFAPINKHLRGVLMGGGVIIQGKGLLPCIRGYYYTGEGEIIQEKLLHRGRGNYTGVIIQGKGLLLSEESGSRRGRPGKTMLYAQSP